jgi:hypothetical protein
LLVAASDELHSDFDQAIHPSRGHIQNSIISQMPAMSLLVSGSARSCGHATTIKQLSNQTMLTSLQSSFLRRFHQSSGRGAAAIGWTDRSLGSRASNLTLQTSEFAHDAFFAQHKPLAGPVNGPLGPDYLKDKEKKNRKDPKMEEYARILLGLSSPPPDAPEPQQPPTLADLLLKDLKKPQQHPKPHELIHGKPLYLPRRPTASAVFRQQMFKRYLKTFENVTQRVTPPKQPVIPPPPRNPVQGYVEDALLYAKSPHGWKRMSVTLSSTRGRVNGKTRKNPIHAALSQVLTPISYRAKMPNHHLASIRQVAETNVLFTMGVPPEDVLYRDGFTLDPPKKEIDWELAKLRVNMKIVRRRAMNKKKLKKRRRLAKRSA